MEVRTEEVKTEPVASEVPPIKPEITYEEFEKVDLRAAKVIAAERVPKSSKLLKLTVEIDGKRQIVAGMGKEYSPEEIVGKMIVVVANLKPAKLHGRRVPRDAPGHGYHEGLTLLGFDRPPKTGAKIH